MHIVTNLRRFPETWRTKTGHSGTAKLASTTKEFLKEIPNADLFLINSDPKVVLELSALSFVRRMPPIVALDPTLRRPQPTMSGRMKGLVKKFLFKRVSHFIHYFTDLSDYNRYFGIGPDRSSFVPFKPNIRYRYEVEQNPDGAYALCFGRSLRDYDTFLDAMEQVSCPGAITEPNFAHLKAHGGRFTRPLDKLPANVSILPDDGTPESLLRLISGAKLIVLPILKGSPCASGIGTYLNSMYMKKCVIISEGIGSSDVLTSGQALLFPPEDPVALAKVIQMAWDDDELRLRTAETGFRYADSLGGEPEMRQRTLEKTMEWYSSRKR
jgi:glycosyltransferase involved in cell wall biosynthesis